MMAASNGNCFVCGKTAGKTAIKNHLLKEHNDGDQQCYLLKAEGAYDKGYWLFFTVPINASLSIVDKFLRDIWCECCGHLSEFSMGGYELAMTQKLSVLDVGDTLLYEYDFGTTTDIVITVVDKILRSNQKKAQLLARNVPPEEVCELCGAPAIYVHALEGDILCEECAENSEDEEMLLLITNSPRCGECGYEGEFDVWEFDPAKPFPQ